MGRLGKFIFADFTSFDCERRVFLDLAEKDARWMDPLHKIAENPWAEMMRKQTDLVKELGHKHEQAVYTRTQLIAETRVNTDAAGKTIGTKVEVADFQAIAMELNVHPDHEIILLEHYYPLSKAFIRYCLNLNPTDPIELDNVRPPKKPNPEFNTARPDIIILSNKWDGKSTVFELKITVDATGKLQKSVQAVSDVDLLTRYRINIIDVKHTNEEKVGKKHFAEILFYMWTLACYLQETGLDSQFYVALDQNGIFPKINANQMNTMTDLYQHIVPMQWYDSEILFDGVVEIIRRLWLLTPCAAEKVSPHITPMCGRWCEYLPDCIESMGCPNKITGLETDVRLLPYTQASIAEQLREYSIENLGTLARGYKTLMSRLPTTPNPLYTEIPFLENKVKAMLNHKKQIPTPGTLYSNVIPKFSALNITFDLESDPINERVHTFGIHAQIWSSPKQVCTPLLGEWWKLWAKYLEQRSQKISASSLWSTLLTDCNVLIEQSHKLGTWPSWVKTLFLTEDNVKTFGDVLEWLCQKDPAFYSKRIAPFLTYNAGDPVTSVIFEYAYVNNGIDDSNEYALTQDLVSVFYNLLEFFILIEHYITSDSSPTALYYWGADQMDDFRELFERHLGRLVQDPTFAPYFEYVMRWISPNQSFVQNPISHKKLYDLKAFGQTVCSYPFIIDYTWHQIAELEIVKPGYSFHRSPQYWPDHFNYMVFKPWHDMLLEQNTNTQLQNIAEIKRQILIKARTIDELRTVFQKDGRDVVFPERSSAIGSMTYARRLFGPTYHLLGQVWYLFAKLNATFDEIDAEHFRLMYPQWSIGKLKAGEVSNLQRIPMDQDETEFCYEFDLYNMSIYMKLEEGSYVLLLHDAERSQYVDAIKHRIIIEQMIWQTDHFHVISENTDNKLASPTEYPIWFLFPNSSDPWSRKLYVPPEDRKKSTKFGLLDRENFGTSWLGQYLAFNWALLPDQKFPKASQSSFSLPEVYLFAPQFLPRASSTPHLLQPLLTQISVDGSNPDESQHKGINCALNETISAIQGPPGTGKTQTIVALMDEFLLRFKKTTPNEAPHILITALSYAAMTEVLRKLVKSKDAAGNQLPIVKLPQIFARSKGEDPRTDVHDLVYETSWHLDQKPLGKKNTLETLFPEGFVMFANAHILYSIGHSKITHSDFHFDLIVVDEASQLPVDHFMAALQFVNHITGLVPCTIIPPDAKHKFGVVQPAPPLTFGNRTQIVIVGDHNQLPPVQQVEPPYHLRCVLNSLFSFYVGTETLQGHGITNHQLTMNYRSNQQIVDYTNQLECYDKQIISHLHNASYQLLGPTPSNVDPWIAILLEPTKIVCSLIHEGHFETSVSALEAEIVAKVIWGYYETIKPSLTTKAEEIKFWDKIVGVVAPHNAQCHLIRRNIMALIRPCYLSPAELQIKVHGCVASVDKFQGSERELIVSSIGISAKEQLQAEETFIYELTRFNVLTSRAKSKILVITSRNFLQYIPNDRETMESAAKIRQFTLGFCNRTQSLTVPFNGQDYTLEFRHK